MEQHPIPQNITSYEFKLVGEMTLKQFGKAAGGIVIALLINSTHVVFFVKWPLAFIFAAGGLAMAFVPFQDRPLETWMMSFIRCIYAPTIYVWKKKANPNWLEIDLAKKIDLAKDEEERQTALPLKDKEKVTQFINSLPSVQKEEDIEEEVVVKKSSPPKVESKPVEVAIEAKPMEDTAPVTPPQEAVSQAKANLNLKTEKLEATGQVVFGTIPMPSRPEEPNVLVGMVTDAEGKIIEGAIIEIQDNFGNPVRVLKTNALGQFRASTQLASGEYLVIPEKDKYSFDRVKVVMDGRIVEPIKIQARTDFSLKSAPVELAV